MVEHCSKAVSVALGYSDHNLVALIRKTNIPKAGPKIIYRRSDSIIYPYKRLYHEGEAMHVRISSSRKGRGRKDAVVSFR
jgi:hypothetical protein